MKTSISTLLLCAFSFTTITAQVNNAQPATANPSGTTQPATATTTSTGNNKGHFVFGTNLFNYDAGSYKENDYSNGTSSGTSTENFSVLSFSFNIWAGYFISDKVCAGINFNTNTPLGYYYGYPNYYYYNYSPFVPGNLFFRYYLFKGDSISIADIFLEGIIGANYSSSSYSQNGPVNSQTDEPVNIFTFNSNVNMVFSFNTSKHFAIQAKLGLVFDYLDVSYPSQNTTPPQHSTISSPAFIGTLALQYKI